jgi:hypothetical protein
MSFAKMGERDVAFLPEREPAPAQPGSRRLEEISKALSAVPSGDSGRARSQTAFSNRIMIVPLANPVCGRVCAGGNGSRLEGTWQVGFETAAACFAPLLAAQICR